MTRRVVATVSILSFGAFVACAQGHGHGQRRRPPELPNDVPPLVRLMVATSARQRFSGARTVEFRLGGKTDRHDEIVVRLRGRTRVDFPADSKLAGQVIVEDDRERRHYYPDKNEIRVSPPRREEALDRLTNLASTKGKIRFSMAGGEVIANVRCEQVVVSDPSGNVMQRLWIDPRSGMLLKRELFDHVGAPVGSFTFTQIDLNPSIDERIFVIDRKGATIVTPLDQLKRLCKKEGYDVFVLPPSSGMQLEGCRIITRDGEKVLSETYVARPAKRVTLFVVKGGMAVDDAKLKQFVRGDYASATWKSGPWTLVLIGSVEKSVIDHLATQVVAGTP